MRENKFRIKKISDGKWLYWNLLDSFASGEEPYNIGLGGTEGQYTGLKDKNGTEIYEGDILRFFDEEHRENIFDAQITRVGLENIEKMIYYRGEVIGNIYENPESTK